MDQVVYGLVQLARVLMALFGLLAVLILGTGITFMPDRVMANLDGVLVYGGIGAIFMAGAVLLKPRRPQP